MSPNEYGRNMSQTPKSSGAARRGSASHIFVVQKHDASRLHYDFRLEIKGVLVSWALPKGPSMNPADRRLAVRTEDHPLDYADFEGVIPKGEYGGGTVMVWDRGTYESKGRALPDEQLGRGKIDVALRGKKLRGDFTLIRTGRASPERGRTANWLLIKQRDEFADPSWDIESPELNRSSLTGRTLMEIAEAERSKVDNAGLRGLG